jgi:hypothetical protein
LLKYDKFYCKGILKILPKKKYYYHSYHHTSSYKKRRDSLPTSEEVFKLVADEGETSSEILEEEIFLQEEIQVEEKEEEVVATINGNIQAGDTLYESLIREGISAAEILSLQEKIKSVVFEI